MTRMRWDRSGFEPIYAVARRSPSGCGRASPIRVTRRHDGCGWPLRSACIVTTARPSGRSRNLASFELIKRMRGSDSAEAALAYCRLGTAYMDADQQKKALAEFAHAKRVIDAYSGTDQALVSNVLGNLGNAWVVLGERQQAIAAFEKALAVRTRLFGTSRPRQRRFWSASVTRGPIRIPSGRRTFTNRQ